MHKAERECEEDALSDISPQAKKKSKAAEKLCLMWIIFIFNKNAINHY